MKVITCGLIIGLTLLTVTTALAGEEQPRSQGQLIDSYTDWYKQPFAPNPDSLGFAGKSTSMSVLGAEDLNGNILALMDTYHIPGAQACIILNDSIVWSGEYGFMDAAQTMPVTDSTLFLLASISKTVITTALLQCVENGQVDLDADVGDYLPFPVRNPYFPSTLITCRMILSHVSSIDRKDDAWIPDMVYGEDWSGDLSQFLEDYLVPGGPTYSVSNYLPYEPGTYAMYSNGAFALLALVIENVTAIDFETYVQDSVFAFLDMNESSWFIANLDTNNIAMPIGGGTIYDVGDYPRSVTSGDINGNGVTDLIVANYYSNDVSILIDSGNGLFHTAVNYTAGNGPSLVFCSDLDGDTDKDLAVANSNSNDVSILLNNGDGTFQTAVNYPTGFYPWSVFCADFDGVNGNDLAVTNGTSNKVSILLGNGDGTFQTAVNYATGVDPRSIFGCDLDGDTDNDLAIADRGAGTISIMLNNGDGTFASRVIYGVGGFPRLIVAADFDGVNGNDLAVANSLSNNVQILLNNGDGSFASAVNYAAGDAPQSIFASDLDGDSAIDLAVANSDSDEISVLLGNGDGTFQAANNYFANSAPYSITCSDLNGDDVPDIAVANVTFDQISIKFGIGDGTFEPYAALGHISHPLWPIGTLKTSAHQLAHHLATIPGYGKYKDQKVLDSLSVDQIMTNHYPAVYTDPVYRGLGWKSVFVDSRIVWGHDGGLPGCGTLMFVDPITGNGAILLANAYYNAGHEAIFNLLMSFSKDTDGDGVLVYDDNCPLVNNPGQEDTDDNGIGDACCCINTRGNANSDPEDKTNIADVTYLVSYLFGIPNGPLPGCPFEGNVNGDPDEKTNISDVTFLTAYLFGVPSGPAPPSCL